MTNTEYLRKRIEDCVPPPADPDKAAAAISRANRVHDRGRVQWLLKHAKARIIMGTFRYETTTPWPVLARQGLVDSYMEKLIEKVEMYQETGNQEFLIDVVNYVLLELTEPCHPKQFFKSEERKDEGCAR